MNVIAILRGRINPRAAMLGLLVLGGVVGYVVHAARASGIPPTGALVYSGVVTNAAGVPQTTGPVEVTIYNDASGGSPACPPASTNTIDATGRFQVTMPDACATVVGNDPTLYVQLAVAGNPVGRQPIGAVPYAIEANNAAHANVADTADQAANAAALQGSPASAFAPADHPTAWADITGVPAGLADGDNNTTYSNGPGLSLAATTFGVDSTYVQRRISPTTGCAAGSSIRGIAEAGTLTCEPDDDTTYLPGNGLSLTSNQFNVDPTYVQRRISPTTGCAAGSSIRVISEAGVVTCEPDDNTTYAPGSGLSLNGTTLSVDPAVIQQRITSSCAAGSSIRTIAQDGSVTCEADTDTDTNTTYSAGAGLLLSSTTFSSRFQGTNATMISRVGTNVNPATTTMLWQAGTAVLSLNASGDGTLTFPTPFPNGVLTVLAFGGDTINGGQTNYFTVTATTTTTMTVRNSVIQAGARRMEWIAIGW